VSVSSKKHDIVVIGAGPGGYIAAIRAAQLGLDVACVEKEPVLGGTCLRIGCIPSKAMLESSELLREAREGLAAHGVRIERVDLDLATMLKRKNDVVRANTSGVEFLFKKNKVTRYLGTARFAGPGKLAVGTDEIAAKHFVVATGSVSAPLRGVELDGDRIATSIRLSPGPTCPRTSS
jgi:dihydrolipoamide dehydrogenase